ncbi:MAG: hypothetical protein KatS3mg094_101 [Candidatus Parcubacteria bacterium]|nr:MAG: hypothetical protein KatS3mg094_101 [Candidatus Parcubacteria bacterium]
MDKTLRNSIIVFLFSFLIICFWFAYEYSKNVKVKRLITVIGEGEEIVTPNIAEIRIGIITKGEDLKTIQEENDNKINKIIDFIKSNGIDSKDIKTENYTIHPDYDYNTYPSQIIGYSISQNLKVKIRDLNKISNILKKVVSEYGANDVYGPDFTVDEIENYLEKAKEKAILNAKEKAEKIAKTAGVKLGRIISISESSISGRDLSSFYNSAGRGGGEYIIQSSPKIEPGSQEIKTQVSVIFEIK